MRTKEWLFVARKEAGLTQKKLSELTGVSTPAIAKIESGERFGSPETWIKLESVLDPNSTNASRTSNSVIKYIKDRLSKFGTNKGCNVYYVARKNNIFFISCIIDEDLEKVTAKKNEVSRNMKSLRVTLLEALDLFESQNRII